MSGCSQETVNPVLVGPDNKQYACSAIRTAPAGPGRNKKKKSRLMHWQRSYRRSYRRIPALSLLPQSLLRSMQRRNADGYQLPATIDYGCQLHRDEGSDQWPGNELLDDHHVSHRQFQLPVMESRGGHLLLLQPQPPRWRPSHRLTRKPPPQLATRL
ncbi:hypothetical protein VTK26DRAFT_25 [Humicola hyalothermophila]